jgi:hypothetical protein
MLHHAINTTMSAPVTVGSWLEPINEACIKMVHHLTDANADNHADVVGVCLFVCCLLLCS